ncbi:MAG TPA: threonine--tRNA ligase [Dehalococcoidales bacterium]|nr:threonine--tRNA ligase [Dehalococcoidales bacterium]
MVPDRKTKSGVDEALDMMRHSTAHMMAEAVQSMFPEAKFGIGPTIEDGFYYDFDLPRTLTPEDLPVIEARIKDIVAADEVFTMEEVTKESARELFADQPYKLELIDELPEEKVTVYRQGSFTDMCRGPHVASSGKVGAFKLTGIAGAYWRGSERNPMLQRIYGTAWPTAGELEEHLKHLEELETRDHRRLNRQLNLYISPEEVGGGLIIYGPKAGRIRTLVEDFWRKEHYANGYELLYTPHIGRSTLWETSGHLDFYRENMYSPMDIEGQEYYLKPMNCPFHILFYKSQMHSYRDLPLRWAELGTVYRYEKSGVLLGLLRTRGFTQDDAHIICTPEQVEDEIDEVLRFSLHMWQSFGFEDYKIYIATRPDKAIGTEEQWQRASEALSKVVEGMQLPYEIDKGGGAFYGPKIDIKIKDALGREWQMTTIQFDFNLPERFDMVYTGPDGQEHRPYMVHRALLGAWCRFFGLLIEHYAGAFPVWLAPLQAIIIPVADRHLDYARKLETELRREDIRADVDARSERMNLKIRQAQLDKVPCMLVVGDKELESSTVSIRLRTGEQLQGQSIDAFKEGIRKAISERAREYPLLES